MVRWTIVLEAKDHSGGSDVIGVRKLLKNAMRWHGLRCVGSSCVWVFRDDRERREALAEWMKGELAKRVAREAKGAAGGGG
jgi:hypothetical protein